MHEKSKIWKNEGSNKILKKLDVKNVNSSKSVITFDYELSNTKSKLTTSYTIYGNGEIQIENNFTPGDKLPELPRFGALMRLPKRFEQISWLGRGPFENYEDRKTAAFVDVYKSTVTELYYPYISPQENGYRTDVRWLGIADNEGNGLFFGAYPVFGFSALHYTMEDLSQESRGGKHTIDLTKQEFTELMIDYKQRGVGGDDS
ncbi:MAG: hypothetical protein B6I20_05300 [Bacteroidetes bacterium 4572_117]|nr:MAG: hypothetical protein B6I20_05300 [Bacteroidetes bacterium 4572_117]